MEKALILYNPVSGTKESENYISELINALCSDEHRVEVRATQSEGDATQYITDHGSEFDTIVALGGDGTLNEVINGMMHLKKRPVLGYIPTGSTNDFATGIGISAHSGEEQVLIATRGKEATIDVGRFNDQYFAYVAAFGVFTSVSYRTSQDQKNAFGKLAYMVEGIKDLSDVKALEWSITSNEKNFSGKYLLGLISNSSQVAGSDMITDTTYYSDGLFEVKLVKEKEGILGFASSMSELLFGTGENKEAVESFRTSKLSLSCEHPIDWTLDGEHGGEFKDVEIENIQKAITIRVGMPDEKE